MYSMLWGGGIFYFKLDLVDVKEHLDGLSGNP